MSFICYNQDCNPDKWDGARIVRLDLALHLRKSLITLYNFLSFFFVHVNNNCSKYARLPVFNDKVSSLKRTATSVRTTNKQQTASDFELSA